MGAGICMPTSVTLTGRGVIMAGERAEDIAQRRKVGGYGADMT
jgi:hypothetical protein